MRALVQFPFLILFVAFASGCARTAPSISDRLAPQLIAMRQAIDATSASPVEKQAQKNEIDDKVAMLQKLELDFDTETRLFEKELRKLTRTGNLWGYEGVVIKRAGLLAGIGAAALIAASPANAVWIAGLSGFAGAANGYASASGAEGFSKAAVAAYMKPIVERANRAITDFSLVEAQSLLWDRSKLNQFAIAVTKQRTNVNRLRAARLELLQPVTPVESAEELLEEFKATTESEKTKRTVPTTPN